MQSSKSELCWYLANLPYNERSEFGFRGGKVKVMERKKYSSRYRVFMGKKTFECKRDFIEGIFMFQLKKPLSELSARETEQLCKKIRTSPEFILFEKKFIPRLRRKIIMKSRKLFGERRARLFV